MIKYDDNGITPTWKKRFKILNRICRYCHKSVPFSEGGRGYYHFKCRKEKERLDKLKRKFKINEKK